MHCGVTASRPLESRSDCHMEFELRAVPRTSVNLVSCASIVTFAIRLSRHTSVHTTKSLLHLTCELTAVRMVKLHLSTRPSHDGGASAAPPADATPATPSSGGLKLTLKRPPPPPSAQLDSSTPAVKAKRSYVRKPKRPAEEDISPAPKRPATAGPAPAPKLSLKASRPAVPQQAPRITALKVKPVKKITLTTENARRAIPPRPRAQGYDSEDSDVEKDPAVQQGLILRMQPGPDADLLRDAISNGRIGLRGPEGGIEVSLRFIRSDLRRAVVKIQGRKYGAALVDLPCIVESMKSWDKKGWWKVSDVCQMLLVLGRVDSEEEVKNLALPKDVEKGTMQYAHGLTPPMHWVRRRRFRKRMTKEATGNVEEEVEKLLKADEECEKAGGRVHQAVYTKDQWERMQNGGEDEQEEYDDPDADGEAMETVEGDEMYDESQAEQEDEEDDVNLEAELQGAFDEDNTQTYITDSPAAMLPDISGIDSSAAATPVPETPNGALMSQSEAEVSSDEDESDEDSDSPSVVDEEAAERAALRAQQMEEIGDLEREVKRVRDKVNALPNQLLRRKEEERLRKLELDLRVKRDGLGLDGEADAEADDDDDGFA